MRGDRGVASVEFAFVLPVLLLLSIVAAEFGFALADWLAVSNATRTGARVVSAGGDDPSTDTAVLNAIEEAFSGAPRADITSVEIFEVLPGGSQGATQQYPYSGGFGACSVCAWPPASRSDQLASLDTAGVRVNFNHNWVIGLWSNTPAGWGDSEVIRIEPDFQGP
ncbi:MAG: pilus assembly protein [Acidimicrobiia bacterium]|nr:pilus assembly protein [Acidimicrobiia bacterium]